MHCNTCKCNVLAAQIKAWASEVSDAITAHAPHRLHTLAERIAEGEFATSVLNICSICFVTTSIVTVQLRLFMFYVDNSQLGINELN